MRRWLLIFLVVLLLFPLLLSVVVDLGQETGVSEGVRRSPGGNAAWRRCGARVGVHLADVGRAKDLLNVNAPTATRMSA
jgi:hypothetical protein